MSSAHTPSPVLDSEGVADGVQRGGQWQWAGGDLRGRVGDRDGKPPDSVGGYGWFGLQGIDADPVATIGEALLGDRADKPIALVEAQPSK